MPHYQVLVIEPHQYTRDLMSYILTNDGIAHNTADNCANATPYVVRSIYSKYFISYDLGDCLLRGLSIKRRIPYIMIYAISDQPVSENTLSDHGFSGCVLKPLDPEGFRQLVREIY